MFKIFPYKVGSASVRKLKEAIDAVVIKRENSRYKFKDEHFVINWGSSTRTDNMQDVPMLNSPEFVAVAANKLLTLQELENEEVPTVPFTTDKEVAQQWAREGAKVFVRTTLTGHSGEGIQVVGNVLDEDAVEVLELAQKLDDAGYHTQAEELREDVDGEFEELPDAPLYTKGVENHGEYRVHVLADEVILYQKKSRKVDEETGEVITADGEDADVRNLASNWIYRTGNLRRLERIEELALDAIAALKLDFGAVDIIMDEKGDVFVLEINSAPGLGNTDTLEAYANGFNNLVNN